MVKDEGMGEERQDVTEVEEVTEVERWNGKTEGKREVGRGGQCGVVNIVVEERIKVRVSN